MEWNVFFKGYMKDIGIWSSALTQEEIVKYMNGEGTFDEQSLAGFWKMNEGKGESIGDSSLNKINGIASGGVWQDPKEKNKKP